MITCCTACTNIKIIWHFKDNTYILSTEKPASMSTVYDWGHGLGLRDAHYGNDGLYTGEESLVHSEEEEAPYWMVDLESECVVIAVVFFNRIVEGMPGT